MDRNKEYRLLHISNIALMSILLVLLFTIAILTSMYSNSTPRNALFLFAVQHHIGIMIFAFVMAVAFGFTLSTFSYRELRKSKEESRSIIDVVLRFLSAEERQVIEYLLRHEGVAPQAEISRIENMGRVKAHRTLAKLEERHLIKIETHGKIRRARLKEEIRELLR